MLLKSDARGNDSSRPGIGKSCASYNLFVTAHCDHLVLVRVCLKGEWSEIPMPPIRITVRVRKSGPNSLRTSALTPLFQSTAWMQYAGRIHTQFYAHTNRFCTNLTNLTSGPAKSDLNCQFDHQLGNLKAPKQLFNVKPSLLRRNEGEGGTWQLGPNRPIGKEYIEKPNLCLLP